MLRPFFVAGEAGSGKTTKLMERAVVLGGELLSGPHQSALAIAVMHGARKHLQVTLRRSCQSMPVTISTIHSFSLKIINRWRRSLGLSLPITICESSIGLAELNGRTHATFDEVMQLACRLLESGTVRNTVAESHPFVLVDEFQDCTGDTLRFVQALGNSTRLLLAADHFQMLTATGEGCPAVDWVEDLRKKNRIDYEELTKCNRTDVLALLRAARALRDDVRATECTVPVYYGQTPEQLAYRMVERFMGWGGKKPITETCALIALSLDDIQLSKLMNSFKGQLARRTQRQVDWSQETSQEREQKQLFEELGITSPGGQWFAKKKLLGTQASCISEDVVRFCRLRGVEEIPQDLVMQFARLAIHNTRAFSKGSPRFQVLTVHGAKNREFGHVFIFWGYKKSGWPAEEQRRLLYNAVTRAKLDCTVLFLGDAEKAVQTP